MVGRRGDLFGELAGDFARDIAKVTIQDLQDAMVAIHAGEQSIDDIHSDDCLYASYSYLDKQAVQSLALSGPFAAHLLQNGTNSYCIMLDRSKRAYVLVEIDFPVVTTRAEALEIIGPTLAARGVRLAAYRHKSKKAGEPWSEIKLYVPKKLDPARCR